METNEHPTPIIERGLIINPYKYEKEPTRISASKFPNHIPYKGYKRPKPKKIKTK